MRNKVIIPLLVAFWSMMSGRAALAIPAQEPLFLVSEVSPMVMFAMSVDHQLFMKAFADYSDLNGDGVIDNTYTDSFDYYGYFDSNRCYQYNTSGNYFEPKDAASGTNSHHCNNSSSDGDWSGNFMNWATMARIDVLRKALYGGKRAVDSTTQTILERALLPHDVHAFVKVFTPASGDSLSNYLPSSMSSAGTVSICNSTPPPTSGDDKTHLMSTASNHPKARFASGDWGRWSADEVYQCEWRNNGVSPGTSSNIYGSGSSAPSVRVEACADNKLETNCRTYDVTTNAKPIGLLQEYGEDRTLRFGLTTGSYKKRDKGGILRKQVGYFAGNTVASNDEINLTNGTINTSVNGIISTLNKVRINAWDYSNRKYDDCNTYGISINTYLTSNASNRQCSNWGNPLSEIYLEAVRYMMGQANYTSTYYESSDSLGLPSATWVDPMPATDYCTPMNVVVVASGDNSFDTDHLSNVPAVLGGVDTATDAIGVRERTAGVIPENVFVGEVGSSPMTDPDSNTCSAKTFTSLSEMRGLCPATPTKQGGYGIAGLAHKAHTTDLRNDRTDDQHINTYAIAMAKNLPDFKFKVGTGEIAVVPIAYAGPTNSLPPQVSSNWKASSLANLNLTDTVYDGSGNLTYARFLALWEDSAWGNDYDMDVISQIAICVGAECTNHDDDNSGSNDTNPGTNTMRVTTRIVHKFAGVSVKVGFVVSGTSADGVYDILRYKNGDNFSASDFDNSNAHREPTPEVRTFTAASSAAGNIPTPLQLAAKYGSFNDINDDGQPDTAAEWDEDGDGVSDSFFFADDPSQIGPKLAAYLSTIATTSSSASVVANSVSLQTTTRIYQARFDSTDWSGDVVAFPVDVATGQLGAIDFNAGAVIAGQAHGSRKWITYNPSTGVGVPFAWSSDGGTPTDFTDDTSPLSDAQRALLALNPASNSVDDHGVARLDYLRGDSSNEARNASAGATFRFRDRAATTLGDVVNSTPTVVAAPSFGYRDDITASGDPTYSSFKAQYDASDCVLTGSSLEREPMLYFGANDGALHGISACTGHERIAYVPNALFPTLSKLTSQQYQHQYYVDGASTVVDAFFDSGTDDSVASSHDDDEWHTVLIGSLRAGGKAVFALDVTDPADFLESNADDLVLWEKSNNDTDYAEMGYSYSQPAIVKTEHHGWVAIFGNGYHGASGKAVLYVARIHDGELLVAIDLSASGHGSGAHGSNNGLSTVAPIDRDRDGLVDLLYAGDRNGNVWRFDTRNSSGTATGFNRSQTTLLYSAKNKDGNAQSITSRMAVGYHPHSVAGRMVYFGTGKYYETTDQDPANAVVHNTMYGIWDRDNGPSGSGPTVTSVETRNSSVLQKQTIEYQDLNTFGTNVETIRVLSNTPVAWVGRQNNGTWNSCSAANGLCGWYLDLTDTGEKMVNTPILRGGRLIFVTTMPSPIACDEGGSGWLMEIDPATGGRLDIAAFDLDGDKIFDDDTATFTDGSGTQQTLPPSGKKSKVGILQPPAILAGIGGSGDGSFGGAEGKYSSGTKDAAIDVTIENPGGLTAGRKSWARIK